MRVQDRANVLTAEQEIALARKSEALERETTDQVVVVTVPSLDGRPIEDVGLDLARGMKLGRADVDNGVLLLVAPKERKIRIDVGYGLEGLLTDDRAGTIVRQMIPKFREGNLGGAVDLGMDRVDALLRSERRRPQYLNEQRKKAAA